LLEERVFIRGKRVPETTEKLRGYGGAEKKLGSMIRNRV